MTLPLVEEAVCYDKREKAQIDALCVDERRSFVFGAFDDELITNEVCRDQRERPNQDPIEANDEQSDLLRCASDSGVDFQGGTLVVVEHRRLTACRNDSFSSTSPSSISTSSSSISSSSPSRSSSSEVECGSIGEMLDGGRCAAAFAPSPQQLQPPRPPLQQPLKQPRRPMSGETDLEWCKNLTGKVPQAHLGSKEQEHFRLQEYSFEKEEYSQCQNPEGNLEKLLSTLDPSSLQLQNNLQFRFLHPDDIDELKNLCKDCFPVEYPEEWYQEITKDDGRFFSLASTLRGRIVGFIVAEIKTRVRCNKEDQDILSPSYPLSTPIAYILSLGVLRPFRCQGVGSLLLDNLLNHLTSKEHHTCKAVFLHVLCTNSRAIRFYECRNFAKHSLLPLYYSIQGKLKDGYSYVLYLNGGHPPWSLRSSVAASVSAIAAFSPCKMSSRFFLRVNQVLWCFLAAVFFGIKRTTMTTTTTTSSAANAAVASTNVFPDGYHKS